MSIEKRAIRFVQKYLEKKKFSTVRNVERDGEHAGYDFLATRKGEKPIKIEVKGCSRLWGIPDLYFTEVKKSKRLVADWLYVVYLIGRKRPQLCRIPGKAIKSKFFIPKKSFRISGEFKNKGTLGPFMDP